MVCFTINLNANLDGVNLIPCRFSQIELTTDPYLIVTGKILFRSDFSNSLNKLQCSSYLVCAPRRNRPVLSAWQVEGLQDK